MPDVLIDPDSFRCGAGTMVAATHEAAPHGFRHSSWDTHREAWPQGDFPARRDSCPSTPGAASVVAGSVVSSLLLRGYGALGGEGRLLHPMGHNPSNGEAQHLVVSSVGDGIVCLVTEDFQAVQMPESMLPAGLEVGAMVACHAWRDFEREEWRRAQVPALQDRVVKYLRVRAGAIPETQQPQQQQHPQQHRGASSGAALSHGSSGGLSGRGRTMGSSRAASDFGAEAPGDAAGNAAAGDIAGDAADDAADDAAAAAVAAAATAGDTAEGTTGDAAGGTADAAGDTGGGDAGGDAGNGDGEVGGSAGGSTGARTPLRDSPPSPASAVAGSPALDSEAEADPEALGAGIPEGVLGLALVSPAGWIASTDGGQGEALGASFALASPAGPRASAKGGPQGQARMLAPAPELVAGGGQESDAL